jgi:hypothetical protein
MPGPRTLAALGADPPDAVVIDLGRLPAQGRDVGVHLRVQRRTRNVPLVFVGGDRAKVARVREILPDASYATWHRIGPAVERAMAKPPARPVVPESSLAGYSGTPLPRKLGIKPGSVVVLAGAPEGFENVLGPLPEGVVLRRVSRGRRDLTLWFPRSRRDLERRIERMAEAIGDTGLWIAWPKKTSGVASDLTQTVVRRVGLDSGLVDYKICAIDATWSGLKFTRRK